MLLDGEWIRKNAIAETDDGKFKRGASTFRDFVGSETYPLERERYHLYISHACPWCHRTMIVRALKGLNECVTVSVVDPYMGEDGWHFGDTPDPLTGAKFVYELYQKSDPNFTGKVTVPVLWDKQQQTIVNNESSDIIRMFNGAYSDEGPDLYPDELKEEIDALNDIIYHKVNNGVYKAGFATTQEAYEQAVNPLFETLDDLDNRLSGQRYLFGAVPIETDWRLFVTLIRFDEAYVNHFNCNRRMISDYKNLYGYLKDLYQVRGVAGTVHMDHIKQHYYTSHPHLNPQGIIPVGPEQNLASPHGREVLSPTERTALEGEVVHI
ncbi:MAG: glutathione-dependent reductase [Rhodomicrobium sp.]|nr:MAG: glutathione-dependent reductase [Rhodomicrobium sp.]